MFDTISQPEFAGFTCVLFTISATITLTLKHLRNEHTRRMKNLDKRLSTHSHVSDSSQSQSESQSETIQDMEIPKVV
jgi:hypothetical protein